MKIDWAGKLQNFLQTLAFCLAVSAILYSLNPQGSYEVPLVYSLLIGCFIWSIIDFGTDLFPSASHSGWPQGIAAIALPVTGVVVGYFLGTLCADQWFGWSTWSSDSGQRSASIIVTVIAGVASTYYFYSRSRQIYLEHRVTAARRQATEARLKLLESQLEPHMLFNTLANLRALIATDPQGAETMLDRMVDYLRATLVASRTGMHPLEQEFARLCDYLELLSVRMGSRLRFTLELPEALRQHPIPPLLLQPLVENAILHGLEPQVEGGQVTVRAQLNTGLLTLEVEDNGLGFDPIHLTEKPGHGFGLSQVRERLETTYGSSSAITLVAGHAGGTLARITIPCTT